MRLDRRAYALQAALIAALAIQVPMLPGTGLETRDPTTFAPWFQTVSIALFPALMVAGVLSLVFLRSRPRGSASLAVAFAVGMISVTLLDVTGLGGVAPPSAIATFEIGALVATAVTLVFALRFLSNPVRELGGPSAGPPSGRSESRGTGARGT